MLILVSVCYVKSEWYLSDLDFFLQISVVIFVLFFEFAENFSQVTFSPLGFHQWYIGYYCRTNLQSQHFFYCKKGGKVIY